MCSVCGNVWRCIYTYDMCTFCMCVILQVDEKLLVLKPWYLTLGKLHNLCEFYSKLIPPTGLSGGLMKVFGGHLVQAKTLKYFVHLICLRSKRWQVGADLSSFKIWRLSRGFIALLGEWPVIIGVVNGARQFVSVMVQWLFLWDKGHVCLSEPLLASCPTAPLWFPFPVLHHGHPARKRAVLSRAALSKYLRSV